MSFSRRGFLKGLAATAGAAMGTRIAGGGSLIGNAFAAPEPTSLVMIHFIGGYNAIWASAGTLQGSFGVTASNFTALGNGVAMDNVLADAMSPFVKDHVATIGVGHGQSSHPGARRALWTIDGKNGMHSLASAIGGASPNKAVISGASDIDERMRDPVNGVAAQHVLDMQTYLDSIGAAAPGPRDPDRTVSLAGVTASQAMSKNALDASPQSLLGVRQGFADAISTLKQPPASFDLAGLKTAYGVTTNKIASFASKLAAAEMFVRTGVNTVTVFDGGWDTHGDVNGNRVRNQMTDIVPAIKTFMDRMITADAGRNVVLCLMGDFARSLPGSDHQPNLSATVIGKYVKRGSTGRVNADVAITGGAPSAKGFWAYLAAATKATASPFGADPHKLVV
ncbi:MAG: DUF1501 domain-containing protein [Deltaproteobacteria bacterium]|nr:DUF1501 domain-containing protein [Deltaproteobacteria bacterium]